MKVNIENREVTLRYSFRAFMIYEQITGHSFNGQNMTEFITLFYSVLMGSDNELSTDFNHFLDWLDEQPSRLTDFTQWLTDNITKQNNLSPEKEEVKETSDDVKKNK